jgi:hypothetical protein
MRILPTLTASPNGANVIVKDTKRFTDSYGCGYYNSIIMSQKLRPPK